MSFSQIEFDKKKHLNENELVRYVVVSIIKQKKKADIQEYIFNKYNCFYYTHSSLIDFNIRIQDALHTTIYDKDENKKIKVSHNRANFLWSIYESFSLVRDDKCLSIPTINNNLPLGVELEDRRPVGPPDPVIPTEPPVDPNELIPMNIEELDPAEDEDEDGVTNLIDTIDNVRIEDYDKIQNAVYSPFWLAPMAQLDDDVVDDGSPLPRGQYTTTSALRLNSYQSIGVRTEDSFITGNSEEDLQNLALVVFDAKTNWKFYKLPYYFPGFKDYRRFEELMPIAFEISSGLTIPVDALIYVVFPEDNVEYRSDLMTLVPNVSEIIEITVTDNYFPELSEPGYYDLEVQILVPGESWHALKIDRLRTAVRYPMTEMYLSRDEATNVDVINGNPAKTYEYFLKSNLFTKPPSYKYPDSTGTFTANTNHQTLMNVPVCRRFGSSEWNEYGLVMDWEEMRDVGVRILHVDTDTDGNVSHFWGGAVWDQGNYVDYLNGNGNSTNGTYQHNHKNTNTWPPSHIWHKFQFESPNQVYAYYTTLKTFGLLYLLNGEEFSFGFVVYNGDDYLYYRYGHRDYGPLASLDFVYQFQNDVQPI